MKGPFDRVAARATTVLGQRLMILRRVHRLTQGEAARALGVKQGTLSRWENGRTAPTIRHLLALAELYHTTPEALLRCELLGIDVADGVMYDIEAATIAGADRTPLTVASDLVRILEKRKAGK